jgi:dolichol-phosphate mannosyltransferase
LRDENIENIYVVDDGSGDASAAVAESFRVRLIALGETLGVGRALVTGMRRVHEEGFRFCVIMAGNDKDEPREIPRLLSPLRNDEADFVQGSRWLEGGQSGGEMPLYRKWATRLHPFLFSLFVGKKITESTNGFRAFRSALLEDARIDLDQSWLDGYEMEPYFLYQVIRLGYRHKEVPCTKIYPPRKEGQTKMRPFRDWWNILKPMLFLRLGLRK